MIRCKGAASIFLEKALCTSHKLCRKMHGEQSKAADLGLLYR
jgi:hypothetical protein